MTNEEAMTIMQLYKEELSNSTDFDDFGMRTLIQIQINAFDMAIEALKDRPRGEWQRVDEQPYFRKHYHKVCCSVCHKQGSEKYNYCPNCGADMRGGAE